MQIKIEVSARHLHPSRSDLEKLFGPGYKLHKLKDLSQTGQFAAREVVKLIGPRGIIEKARVLGPCRPETQVEISGSDAEKLGLKPPLRDSGDLDSTPGIKLAGPAGEVILKRGVILALRHIHMDPGTAEALGLRDGDRVKVDVGGQRDLLWENVLVRIDKSFRLAMHIDTDEANSAG